MKCPHCNARSRVLATRNLTERRRECEKGHRFSTREEVFVPAWRKPIPAQQPQP